ncbi:Lrp/AsnC family transcriptional regulator [Candidatus Micrarchaeota archaeon]|nr:Lrp/AsnC family transcriptional regulator [Candidatus Micrarchaeota archaeon]
MHMDDLDLKLVKLVQTNSRLKLSELSKELGVSEGTVRNRLFKLEDERIVLQYSAIADPKKLGYQAVAIVGINAEPLKFLTVLDALSRIEDIKSLYTCTGEHSLIFEIWKKDAAELSDFLDQKIKGISGISKTSVNLVLDSVKYSKKAGLMPLGHQTTLAKI